jgi:8-oxo-dGTP pyrophosphatase MutT (NUDIX family)
MQRHAKKEWQLTQLSFCSTNQSVQKKIKEKGGGMNFQYSKKFHLPILVAYAVLDTKNGAVLLVEDRKPKGSAPRTKFPGGKIKLDRDELPLETPFEALKRELSEELGYAGSLTVLEEYEIEKNRTGPCSPFL